MMEWKRLWGSVRRSPEWEIGLFALLFICDLLYAAVCVGCRQLTLKIGMQAISRFHKLPKNNTAPSTSLWGELLGRQHNLSASK